jgi:hypothetical protein
MTGHKATGLSPRKEDIGKIRKVKLAIVSEIYFWEICNIGISRTFVLLLYL